MTRQVTAIIAITLATGALAQATPKETSQKEDKNDLDDAQNKLALRALKSLGGGAGLDDTTQLKVRQPGAGVKSNMDQQDSMDAPDIEEQKQLLKGMLKEEINGALKDGTLQPEDLNDPDTAQNKLALRALKSLGGGAGLDDTTQLKVRQPGAGARLTTDQRDSLGAPADFVKAFADSDNAEGPPPSQRQGFVEEPGYVDARGDDVEIPPPQRQDQLPPTSLSAAAVPSSMSIPVVMLMGAFAGGAVTFALFRPRPETPSDYQILVA